MTLNPPECKAAENQQSGAIGCLPLLLILFIAIAIFIIDSSYRSHRSYEVRGYNAATNADIKNSYTSAVAYFRKHPSGELSLENLYQYGFKSTPRVKLSILNKGKSDLKLKAEHEDGSRVYFVDQRGTISFKDK